MSARDLTDPTHTMPDIRLQAQPFRYSQSDLFSLLREESIYEMLDAATVPQGAYKYKYTQADVRRDGHPKGPRLLPAIEVWADHAPNPDLTRYSPGHPNDSEYEPQGHSDDTTNAHSHPSNVEVERGRDRVGPNKAALSRLIDSLRRSAKTTPRVALVTGWPSYPAFSPTLGRRNFCRTRTDPSTPMHATRPNHKQAV